MAQVAQACYLGRSPYEQKVLFWLANVRCATCCPSVGDAVSLTLAGVPDAT